ncbi:MAG: MBL fold metallo-hydrolase, partial [Chloroflexi bacterium]|nr:MBL fold metallo-hydrolase [Chloroflexota bacterium]
DSEARDPEQVLRAQAPEMRLSVDEPLYTEADVVQTLRQFATVAYGKEKPIASGVSATLLDAGHILGSAIVRLRVRERGRETVIVFSGDLGRTDTPIIRDPTVVNDADYVVVESTYGGREHEPQHEAVRLLAEAIRIVNENQGVLLVPSFAIGRTQEIVWQLDRLIESGRIPRLPLYLDSPMASKASAIYARHREYYDAETRALLDAGNDPFDYPGAVLTNEAEDSKRIRTAKRPYMIVASNGMLTGGRVLHHLRDLIGDPRAVLLFVGYQGQGTLGAHLQAGARTVLMDGQAHEVRCTVRSISGFSAHADESELLTWLRGFTARRAGGERAPKKVFLVHGDPDAQTALAPKIAGLGLVPHVPHWRERVALD